jgi:hypothetical protein
MRYALAALAAGVASLAVGVAVAGADPPPYTTTGPTSASAGATPFAPGCGGPGEGFHTPSEVPGLNFPDTEVEPWFEVNPQDPQDLAGFWQQDRWSDGGAHGLVAGVSDDGGATWTRTFPAFSNCAGGTDANGGNYERSSDPWLSWSPSPANGLGTLHAISLSFDRSTAHNAILASRSLDGGFNWEPPITIREDNSNSGPLANLFNDKESITADPVNADAAGNIDNVYAVWDRIESPTENPLTPPQAYANSLAFQGPIWFARSTDNGASWEEAHKIFDPKPSRTQTISNQIVVLPNGRLVDGFVFITGSNKPGIPRGDNASTIVSDDEGETWSSMRVIANMGDRGVRDPEPVACPGDNTPATPCLLVRTGDIVPDFAVDYENGFMYAVWQSHRSETVNQLGSTFRVDDTILLSRSNDGRNWSDPIKVNHTPSGYNEQAFLGSVEVADNGDVAVTYYDFRNDAPGDTALSTDYWIAHCHQATSSCRDAAGWPAAQENRLTPTPFDMRSAPYAIGYFPGDYEGLDHFGNTFTPFFVQSNGTHANPATDAFYSTAGP